MSGARALLVALGIPLVGVALARPASADRAAAQQYFRAGAKAYAAQSFAAAAQNFDEAYRAEPLPEIAFSAAQAYRRLYRIEPRAEHVRRAIMLYRAYLAQVKSGGRVGDAADNLAEMQRELDRLGAAGAPSSATGPVNVGPARTRLGASVSLVDQLGSEAGAVREIGEATGALAPGLVVSIDGKAVEPFALIEVSPKDHLISASADGYFPIDKKAMAVDGQSVFV